MTTPDGEREPTEGDGDAARTRADATAEATTVDDLDAIVAHLGDLSRRLLVVDLDGDLDSLADDVADHAGGLQATVRNSPAAVAFVTRRRADEVLARLRRLPLAPVSDRDGPGPPDRAVVVADVDDLSSALRRVAARYPGRDPVLIESVQVEPTGYQVATDVGGVGIAVGDRPRQGARWWLAGPDRVRHLLRRISEGHEAGAVTREAVRRSGAHPIEHYGMISDSRTAALVSPDGSVDWLCLPRFDSPSVFAAILDPVRGGRFRIRPRREDLGVQQTYLGETNVLVNRFVDNGDPVLTLTDFLVYSRVNAFDPTNTSHTLVRRVEAFADVEAEITFQPRFDYGRAVTRVAGAAHGLEASAGTDQLELYVEDVEWDVTAHRDGQGDVAHAVLALEAGDERWFVLRTAGAERGAHAHLSPPELLDLTVRTWGRWSRNIEFDSRWRDAVVRSALVLKALVYEPTGAMVAAPTMSLPESIGGERNWDYRYAWIRDSAYVLECFLRIGHSREADTFVRWLSELTDRIGGAHELRPLYRITGEEDLSEFELSHLEGYRKSRPVRVGNGAASQLQLDIYGAAMQLSYLTEQRGGEVPSAHWPVIKELVETVANRWQEPDSGLWEVRSHPRHHTVSRFMCWLAVDRAIRIGEGLGLQGPYDAWRELADEIADDLLENGYNPSVGAFTQSYGSTDLDAAVLLLPLRGFLPPRDERVRRTVEAVRRELEVSDGLLLRYRSPDGFESEEGAFLLCSFWLVELLARMGDLEEAERLFERLLGLAGPLGLYGEEMDRASHAHLGNYPQGFTHMGLITAAAAIAEEHRIRGEATSGG